MLELEQMREILNQKVEKQLLDLTCDEVIKLSQQLDALILEVTKNDNII